MIKNLFHNDSEFHLTKHTGKKTFQCNHRDKDLIKYIISNAILQCTQGESHHHVKLVRMQHAYLNEHVLIHTRKTLMNVIIVKN